MTLQHLDVPDWHHAMSLSERLALLSRPNHADAEEVPETERERLWRTQAPFGEDGPGVGRLQQRLELEGLTQSQWRQILAEPASVVRERMGTPPAFVADFLAAYEQPIDISVDDLRPDPEKLDRRVRGAADFLVAVEPLIARARARLREGLRELVAEAAFVPFDPALVERLWLLDLPCELLGMLDRTFVLELNVARVMDLLHGETPEERFASFIERLRDPQNVLAIFREYPVLARSLAVCVDQWVAYALEFFRHLVTDWALIRATFSPSAEPGPLTRIEIGVGDSHREGRSVLILGFESGFALVYKPKALAVDVHFQELVVWLNDHGLSPALRTITVVDRGKYGWIEMVVPTTCASEAEVHRFYRRQGALVLLTYVLGATDFHYENLLAVGEHPVLIDLETLFHPYAPLAKVQELPDGVSFQRSVLRSGLLPRWGGGGVGLTELDISGLGTKPGQKLSVGSPTWAAQGTDQLHFTRVTTDLTQGKHRATLKGVDVDVVQYVDDVAAGFTDAYRLVVALREQLLAPEGPIARFAHDEVRVLLRNTQRYAFLRYDANHPNTLRDGLDRERSFDKLWLEVDQVPQLAKLIPSERADLWRGDIPMFFTTPSETLLRDVRGATIEGVYEQPSHDQVVGLIRGLGEQDLEQQLWFLRTSLCALEVTTRASRHQLVRKATEASGRPAARERLLEAARHMGRRLTKFTLVDDDVVFLGMLPDGRGGWRFGPIDSNLYHGTAGIALFLGYLGSVADDEQATALARLALRKTLENLDGPEAGTREIGAFEGWSSLLYLLTHLGVLWSDAELLARASALVPRIEALVPEDDRLDIIGGAAGAILVLLGLQQVAPAEAVMQAAIACGEHLLRTARAIEGGIAWSNPKEVLAPLTGFAHGTAGMAHAMSVLAEATGQARFAQAAAQAIAYERRAFVPGRGWPDWRKLEGASLDKPTFEAAWCHGSPGIGMGRLMFVAATGDDAARIEALDALELTLHQPAAPDHCLCHGDLGNIEFFLQAARVLDRAPLRSEAERRMALLLDSLDQHGPICGLPLDAEVPGLMTGVAGIGYGLLRLAEPSRVPSVLLLEPPPVRRS